MKLQRVFHISLAFGLSLGISILLANTSAARVLLQEKTQYYRVDGSNGQEIFKDMLAKGPSINGRRGHFLAVTEIAYDLQNFQMDIKNGKCVTRSFDLIVKAEYTYPKWNGSKKASAATRSNWKIFTREITWHEKQHVKIALDIAADMAKILNTTTARASRNCADISWRLGLKARRIGVKHNRLQKRFDRTDLRKGGRGYKAQVLLINSN